MNLRRTFKVSWEGLTLNKVRSFLTTLGVIIGVAAVIIMLAVSAGAEAEIEDQINALGANLIMVMPSMGRGGFGPGAGPRTGLSYDDIGAIAENKLGDTTYTVIVVPDEHDDRIRWGMTAMVVIPTD